MTFYALLHSAIPFATDFPTIVDQCGDVALVRAMLQRATLQHPTGELEVTETLFKASAAMPKIPPELARAVERWNGSKVLRPNVRAIQNHVGPYRKWKRINDGRTYLLEEVVVAAERVVAADPFWSYLNFGLLMRLDKGGMLNSDKVLEAAAKIGTSSNRTPEPEEDEATRRARAAAFHAPRVAGFIAEHGDPDRSVSVRALFNEWAGSRGAGGVFAALGCSPARDFWDQWKELAAEGR